jgi:hypothetical protein
VEATISILLMIIDDLDVVRVTRAPNEADPPSLVDADAVLTSPITLELFQAICGRNPQVVQAGCSIEHPELPKGGALEVRSQPLDRLTAKQALRVRVLEALDHAIP